MSVLQKFTDDDLNAAYESARANVVTYLPHRNQNRNHWTKLVMAAAAVWNELQARAAGEDPPFDEGSQIRAKDTGRRWNGSALYQPVTYMRYVCDVATHKGKWQVTIVVDPTRLRFGEMQKIQSITDAEINVEDPNWWDADEFVCPNNK